MPFPTTNATQELPALNNILASVGQAPVTTLDQTNPDVAIAYNTLLEVSREVQAEGWTFNREHCVTTAPDDNDNILIPSNVLQVDLTDNAANKGKLAVRRTETTDGLSKLYEKTKHTYLWTENEYELDFVYYYDWVDLPVPVQDYITARAATVTSSRIVGDPGQYRILQQKEFQARANALEYDCNQGDYSFFGHPAGGNFYNSYKPYEALQR